MASSPLRKRPRTDNESGQEELLRDTQFWFEDGSIVVVAQQTAFRVHQGVLSRHSDTFNGLFTIPQPSEGTEKIDCCPVVRVSDSAHDFKHLLHALYDGLNFFEPGKTIRFACAAALARLGHKYELEQVLHAALGRLRIVFTTDLATWRQAYGPGKFPNLSFYAFDGFEAVNLFRTIGCTEMLPVAFYLCALLPNADLIKGRPRADRTLEKLSPKTWNDVSTRGTASQGEARTSSTPSSAQKPLRYASAGAKQYSMPAVLESGNPPSTAAIRWDAMSCMQAGR
ncbi:hypothetical protein C8Q74DRAFT_432137 [Fomes fomentarius]|nr:hypothetical protein C8Q74DRAFT_432137 [Fomes fomentarius]